MVNKNKNLGIIVIMSLIAIVILFSIYTSPQTLGIPPLDSDLGECKGGFTTLSVDDVTINRDRERIRVFGIAKGSECLDIKFFENDLNNKLESLGLRATRNIIGNIRLLEYTKTFPIDRTGDSYKSISEGSFNSVTTLDLCTINNCKKRISSETFNTFQSGLVGQFCHCIYFGSNGLIADFSSSRFYGGFEVLFELDGKSISLSRSNQADNFANGRVDLDGKNHIEWVGNLLNLDGIGVPQYDARLLFSKYSLVKDGAENSVNIEFNVFKDCLGIGPSINRYNSCKATFDSQVGRILEEKLSKYKTDNSALIFDADTDDGNLFVSLKAFPYPAFILDLDAESVGIIILEGKPKITQCIQDQTNFNKLSSGQGKNVQFSVKNDVDVDGVEFFSSISCDRGATGFIPNFNINGLETKNIIAELRPSNPNAGDLNGNCVLEVTDLKSGNSDSCGFDITVEYESGIICEPGELSCSQDFSNLLRCTSDGKNKIVEQECEFGCEISSTGAKCRAKPPPSPTPEGCKDCFEWFSSLFKSENEQCKPDSLIPFKWYNPASWFLSDVITQSFICPIFLLGFGTIVILVIMILVKLFQGQTIKPQRRRK